MWRGGDIIRPLLESVEWCEPIGHRQALARIHAAYSPALFDRLRVSSLSRICPLWAGGDRIRPLLGSVEWHDSVKPGTFPEWDGGMIIHTLLEGASRYDPTGGVV